MNMKKKITNFVLNKLRLKKYSVSRTDEEGSTIRKSRLRKFKKKSKKLGIAAQILAIWYLLIITGSYLTTDTGAYFNDVEVIQNSFHAKWDEYPPDDGAWGKSSLKEVSIRGTCEEGIYAKFTNTGESVDHELTTYKVYWSETGNAKEGVIVESGKFPIPNKNEFYEIYYKPIKNGNYNIKAYHETGHGNGNGDGKGPWSGQISITTCSTPPEDGNDTAPIPQVINEQLGEVTNLKWNLNGNSGKVEITWENPQGEFSHVNVYTDGQSNPFRDKITNGKLDLENVNQETTYKIITVDKLGKESLGIKITVSKSRVIVN